MTKILLVEDDKSLREIYGVRLAAEGYEIVSAGDGEEALAVAIKERPSLIVSDVMMPKISGFDMLDILRSTTETKDIKVIMMTALSSDDQRARGEALGADRYLVKSQVGIEDAVRTVHDVLADGIAAAPNVAPATPEPQAQPAPQPAPQPQPQPQPQAAPAPAPQPVVNFPEPAPAPAPAQAPAPQPAPVAPQPVFEMPVAPAPAPMTAPQPQPEQPQQPAPQPQPTPNYGPAAPQVQPQSQPQPAPAPQPVYEAPAAQPMPQPAPQPQAMPQPAAAPAPMPAPSPLPQPTAPFSTDRPASLGDRIIHPLSPEDLTGNPSVNIAQQMNDELNRELPQPPQPPLPPTPAQ